MQRQRLDRFIRGQGRRPAANPPRLGFTLVELLVVIGIVILMIGILLPALNTARRQAETVRCAANLRQVGTTAVLYATQNRGIFPPMIPESIEKEQLSPVFRKFIKQQVTSGLGMFFCPGNDLWNTYEALQHTPEGAFAGNSPSGQIGYYWVANPDDAAAARFIDTNNDNNKRDEYLVKASDEGAARLVIVTDQSLRTNNFVRNPPLPTDFPKGWIYLHGRGGVPGPKGSNSGRYKNNLYGDGHVEAVNADDVIPRWDASNSTGW